MQYVAGACRVIIRILSELWNIWSESAQRYAEIVMIREDATSVKRWKFGWTFQLGSVM